MNYTEFINEELATNLETIFSKMKEMNIIDNNEFNTNIEVLKKTKKELKKERSKK
ncbi:MAG: hypothetical protein M0R46_16570 [Candidatus Muirbacterium halophilum]|nr:hypothetical protein [Candidatus Muirbacterium halophilum]MCK9477532.1 hypothetical protein [Candidatus Muirbacterium halophilum]